MQKQLSHLLFSHGFLSPFQSGFRPGHSIVTVLNKVSDDIRWAMEIKSLTLLTLLDLSSAFNFIDHDILLGILSSLNSSNSAITWFTFYLGVFAVCPPLLVFVFSIFINLRFHSHI